MRVLGHVVRIGLLVASVFVSSPSSHAVMFKSTANPAYNTNAPTGTLANSGWQYEGDWNSYSGRPIAPNYFITAAHFGGDISWIFFLNGFAYHPVASYDDPNSDLIIWEVAETFPSYAPLFAKTSEVGKRSVVFGRGTQRGAAVIVGGVTKGWFWGTGDGVRRWGENDVATTINGGAGLGDLLKCTFDRNSAYANECHLSQGDSGGALYIQDSGVWKLAGIHYSVDGLFSTNGVNGSGFQAALTDYGGLYTGGDGSWTLQSDTSTDKPSAFYSTRISSHIAWINGVVTSKPPVAPVANFTATPTSGVRPLVVTFTDTSTGTLTNRFWDFGDGATTNTTANILTHTYNSAGTRTVTLIVRGPAGVSTKIQNNLIVVTNPAQLSVAPASLNFGSVTVGLTNSRTFSVANTGDVPLTGTATVGGPFAINAGSSLNVGAGQTQTVTVTFQPVGAGAFSNAVVFSSNGGNSTNPVTGTGLTAGQLAVSPVALDFGTVPTGSNSQRVFVVSNTGGTAVSNGMATVGDPFTVVSGQQFSVPAFGATNVVVKFAPTAAGTATNQVVFASANGGSSTNQVTGTGAIAPIASFTFSPTNGVAPLLVNFTDTSTGTITSRLWNFGDTFSSTLANPSHTYSNAGVYSANLTVYGPVGSNYTSGVAITVTNFIAPPVAGFTASPIDGTAPLLAVFNDTSTGTITNRLWTFGDTGTSTLANPSHTYSNAGVYSVSLTVFGSGGSNTLNRPNLITVTNIVPVAVFTANPTNGAAPLFVFFTDTSTGSITNRLWSFGDGATSGGLAPMHTYTTAGVFSVSLTVAGPTGSDTLNRPNLITVTNVPPVAGFTASPTNGVLPLLVSFTDASTGTVTNRLWNFGDGGSSTAMSPSHTYTNAGSFSVALTIFGPTGTDALTQPNLIVVANAPLPANLEIIKLGLPSPVVVASNLTYTITVTNHGPATATSITLTDVLPASVSFVSASDECTNTAGLVVCDLGSLASGKATNVTLVVVPTVAGKLTNTASVAAAETDPVPANNTVTNIVTVIAVSPPGTNDLAVVKLKAPKKIKLSATTTSKVGKFKVTLQNLGPQTETIPDLATLGDLVTVAVQSLGTNCASFAAAFVPPNKSFPLSVAPNKKLKLSFQATFNCPNDPAATTKTAAHDDYRTVAAVDLSALGEVDTASSNDACPRPPSGSDPGCGNKTASGALGADVLTDVTFQ